MRNIPKFLNSGLFSYTNYMQLSLNVQQYNFKNLNWGNNILNNVPQITTAQMALSVQLNTGYNSNVKSDTPLSGGGAPGWMSGVAQGIGTVSKAFETPKADLNSSNARNAAIRDGVSQALMSSGNPYAMAAAAAVLIFDKTGGFSDASEGLGTATDNWNTAASFLLPGAGYFMSSVGHYNMSDEMKLMASGYGGTMKDNLDAAKNSGAKIFFGRGKARSMLQEAQRKDNAIVSIKESSDLDRAALASMSQNLAIQNQFELTGGYLQGLARAAKYGAKLEKAQATFKLINNKVNSFTNKTKEEDELFFLSFKQGGQLEKEEFIIESFSTKSEQEDLDFFASLNNEVPEFLKGGELNVIPEGALHAHKHHMEGADHFTKKGIPVVSEEEGGELELQAEIERNEIIFRLEVTQKLEELYKKYKESESQKEKDELAIEAGKLLTYEILENTEDRTGLIELVQ